MLETAPIKESKSVDVPTPANSSSTNPNTPTAMIPINKKPIMCGLFFRFSFDEPPVILPLSIAPIPPNTQTNTPIRIVDIATAIVAITLPENIAEIIPCTLEPNSSPRVDVIMLIEKVVAKANTIPAIA